MSAAPPDPEAASPEPATPATDIPGAKLVRDAVAAARTRAEDRVRVLKAKHPKLGRRPLADKLVSSFAFRAGLGGAATGALSLVSLPVGLPAGVALTLATEAELLLSLMDLYGVDPGGEAGNVRLYALWAGSGLADAAKAVGLSAGADALGGIIAGTLPARLLAKLNPVLVKAVLRRLGLGFVPRLLKFWPVVGAPIGYFVDSRAVKALGNATVAALEKTAKPA